MDNSTSPFNQALIDLLRFLILTEMEKLAYLPPKGKEQFVYIVDTHSTTEDPLFFLTYKTYTMLSHIYLWIDNDDSNAICGDLVDLLDVMIALRNIPMFDPFWAIESFEFWGNSTQVFWRLVRDYAKRFLTACNVPVSVPEQSFSDLRTYLEPEDWSVC